MHALQKILQRVEDKDDRDAARVRQYSGRGMYGRECLAVYGTKDQLAALLTEAVKTHVADLCKSSYWESEGGADDRAVHQSDQKVFDDALEVIFHHEQDNMGHDFVYYWPDVEYTEDQDADE